MGRFFEDASTVLTDSKRVDAPSPASADQPVKESLFLHEAGRPLPWKGSDHHTKTPINPMIYSVEVPIWCQSPLVLVVDSLRLHVNGWLLGLGVVRSTENASHDH